MAKFWLGQFHISDEARYALDMEDILIALRRHHNGDWGDLVPRTEMRMKQLCESAGDCFQYITTARK